MSGSALLERHTAAATPGSAPPVRRLWSRLPPPAVTAVVFVAFLGAAAVVLHQLHGLVADDAFITYRYARNLDQGHGWAYNPASSTTDAATAPFYTLLLAAGGLFTANIPKLASLLFVITTAAGGVFAFELLRRRGHALAGLAAGIFLVTCPWLSATRGMETSLFVALALLSVLLLDMRRLLLCGVALGLLTLTRADGGVLVLLLLGTALYQARRIPWRMLVGLVAVAIPWAIFAQVMIGSILPDTLSAKVAQGKSGFWGTGLIFVSGLGDYARIFEPWMRFVLPAAAVGAAWAVFSPRIRSALAAFVVLGLVLVFAYGYVLKPPSYHWYYGPEALALVLLAGAGVGYVAERGILGRDALHAGVALVVGVGIVWTAFATTWQGFSYPHYVDASNWLRDNTPAGARVAVAEFGVIGWYSDRTMVDFLGLLEKQSVSDVERGDLRPWLARQKPDYWVIHRPVWPFERPALTEPWFNAAYQMAWSDPQLVVYRRTADIAAAQAFTGGTVAPFARQVVDAVRGSAPAPAGAADATASLLELVARRPDLQAQYAKGGSLDVAGLLTWAAGPGQTDDLAPSVTADGLQYAQLHDLLGARALSLPIPAQVLGVPAA